LPHLQEPEAEAAQPLWEVLASLLLADRYQLTGPAQPDQLGVVCRAADLSEGNAPRLIRLWAPTLGGDPEFRAQLRRRAASLAAAGRQPALPRVFRSEETRESLLLVTDAPEGRGLDEWISARPQTDAHRALALAIHVGTALEAVHNAGLVHGLLGAGHIEVRDPDEQIRLRGWEYAAVPVRLLRDLDLTAPPFASVYLAPEQRAGQEWSEAADIYAYGCLLQQLLGDQSPRTPSAPGPATGLGWSRLLGLRRRVPLAVRRIVRAARAATPAERPRSMGEILNDLWGELDREPAAGDRKRLGARRHGLALLLAVLVVSAIPALHRREPLPTGSERAVRPLRPAQSSQVDGDRLTETQTALTAPAAEREGPKLPGSSPLSAPVGASPPVSRPEPPPGPGVPVPASVTRVLPSTVEEGQVSKDGRQPATRSGGLASRAGNSEAKELGAPARPVADPRSGGASRRGRVPADEAALPDPASIIDWLLQQSRPDPR
jgi:hypothetical protein